MRFVTAAAAVEPPWSTTPANRHRATGEGMWRMAERKLDGMDVVEILEAQGWKRPEEGSARADGETAFRWGLPDAPDVCAQLRTWSEMKWCIEFDGAPICDQEHDRRTVVVRLARLACDRLSAQKTSLEEARLILLGLSYKKASERPLRYEHTVKLGKVLRLVTGPDDMWELRHGNDRVSSSDAPPEAVAEALIDFAGP